MKYDDIPLWHRAHLTPKYLFRYRAWRGDNRHAIRAHRKEARTRPSYDNKTHLQAALQWLLLSQDESGDDGFVGRYRLDKGWSTAYPETTGYIIPTLLNLAAQTDAGLLQLSPAPEELIERANRAGRFLLNVQLSSGAFPAGEIGANSTKPSPFNTAQIINGLQQLHVFNGEQEYLQAAIRAATWLIEQQDSDGAWRQWFYHNIPATYSTHLACWVAELGSYLGEDKFIDCARANADWAIACQDPATGFFDKCGFTEEEQALRIADLHTIAYNQAGLIRIGKALDDKQIINAAKFAADGVLGTLDRLGWLPGVLDHRWQSKANSACLTGCAQMALIWLDLFELLAEEKYVVAAKKAIEIVKRGQLMVSDNPALRGAIPGSGSLMGVVQRRYYAELGRQVFYRCPDAS